MRGLQPPDNQSKSTIKRSVNTSELNRTSGDKDYQNSKSLLMPMNLVLYFAVFFVAFTHGLEEWNENIANIDGGQAESPFNNAYDGSIRHRAYESMAMGTSGVDMINKDILHMDSNGGNNNLGESVASSLKNYKKFDASKVEKMLVWNGRLTISVTLNSDEFIALKNKLKSYLTSVNGYIERQDERTYEITVYHTCKRPDGTDCSCPPNNHGQKVFLRTYESTTRVPTPSFQLSMDTISSFTTSNVSWVQSSSASSTDVTETYVDDKSRESMLEISHKVLEDVLKQAISTTDVIHAMRELQDVGERLESLRQKIKLLSKSASLSTIHCTIQESSPSPLVVVVPYEVQGTHEWQPILTFYKAIEWLRVGMILSSDALIVSVVVGTPLAAFCTILLLLWYRWTKSAASHPHNE